MSIPQRITDFPDADAGKRDRRHSMREPVVALESGIFDATSAASDPTEDIRNLIDELQKTVRNARAELRVVEVERDDLALQLEESVVRVERLRSNERELRSKFVEVTALISERDAAVAEAKRLAAAAGAAQGQIDSLTKNRNDLARQRDEVIRRLEGLKTATDEGAAQSAEAQKQVLALRQARDAAHAQNREIGAKLSRHEDKLAELEYEFEAAQNAARESAGVLAETRRQLEAEIANRDAATAEIAKLSEELDAQRQKLLDLGEQKAVALDHDKERAAALAEARAQVTSLVQERDVARARILEQVREFEELRQQFQAFQDDHQKARGAELTAANEKMAALEIQARESRQESDSLRQQIEAAESRVTELQQAVENPPALAAMQTQIAALSTQRDAAATAMADLQKRLDEMGVARGESAIQASVREEEITLLRAQLSAVGVVEAEAKERAAEIKEVNARFERQRIETIDIAAQLQAAQREIRELSATLAEARLQVKFASAAQRVNKGSGTRIKAIVSTLHEAFDEDPAPAPRAVPLALGVEQALDPREIKSALAAMRQCYQSFARHEEDVSLLNELYCHVHALSERARDSGMHSAHRLAAAFADLTHGLYQNPVQVNASTMRTVSQTIDFLGSLMKETDLRKIRDLGKARIYAVDDDPDNCESIKLAMETAMLRTDCVLDPVEALAELTDYPCDLILLDVNMPGMDGFELCSRLRQVPIHAGTPIIFLSGLATVQNRTQSSIVGGTDFIAKPFNLYELTVKTLTHILRAQVSADTAIA